MKVCIYLEDEKLVGKSGFKTAVENQKRALEKMKVEVTSDPSSDYDILHLNFFGPRSIYYLIRARRRNKKVIAHAHSTGRYDLKNSFTFSNLFAPLYERYLNLFYSRSDCIFTASAHAKRLLRSQGIENGIFVISNGVDRERYKFSEEKRRMYREKLGLKRFTILSAGNVIPRKGVIDFIEVAERLPEFGFVWYGYRWNRLLAFHPEMHRRIKERPPNVRMPGFVHDTPGAFSAADAFFFPSLGENQPLVLLEAASLGRPLILRDLPEYRGWLKEGVNCLKGRTVKDFVELVRRVAEDDKLRMKLARGAEALAEEHRLERIGEHLCQLYQAVLEGSEVE